MRQLHRMTEIANAPLDEHLAPVGPRQMLHELDPGDDAQQLVTVNDQHSRALGFASKTCSTEAVRSASVKQKANDATSLKGVEAFKLHRSPRPGKSLLRSSAGSDAVPAKTGGKLSFMCG